MIKDITGLEDIQLFVDEFYGKVREDDLIGPVFADVIADWQPHLEKMYAFWNAVLFGEPGFKGNPFAKHAPLPIAGEHFGRWLELFAETIDEHFIGSIAEQAKQKAGLMAAMFMNKLDRMRNGSSHVIV
ncbi:group III truncated hemoglobin [Mucilaginibacter sp. BT774]|uniref:group III truncated hemoglobin n=1 Tax=Mucilaginibacter sp. BT774 TaxID=3062276 RepID=UPI00267586D5|nr:group III truncated hemoglobin [Mucilaginibacter sp. BT774]MDO3627187.1 group III truncated hemoglobin [Mucilaginibacter sp. BT774]